jgi:hypothetical protein
MFLGDRGPDCLVRHPHSVSVTRSCDDNQDLVEFGTEGDRREELCPFLVRRESHVPMRIEDEKSLRAVCSSFGDYWQGSDELGIGLRIQTPTHSSVSYAIPETLASLSDMLQQIQHRNAPRQRRL